MHIDNHWLKGEGIIYKPSPNCGDGFADGLPDTIIIHFTDMDSIASAVVRLCDPAAKVSAHVVIGRDGSIVQLVPFNIVAWHAGVSRFKGRESLNQYSIGIELDNAGRLEKVGNRYRSWLGIFYDEGDVIEATHPNKSTPSFWHKFTEVQLTTTKQLCRMLNDSHQINHILGHDEVSPGRKIDPGPAFPMVGFREWLLK